MYKRQNLNHGMQESGVGIFYREDFNSFKDLVQLFKNRFASLARRRAERKAARQKQREAKQKVLSEVPDAQADTTVQSEEPKP
mgnify:CR=1 FL=1